MRSDGAFSGSTKHTARVEPKNCWPHAVAARSASFAYPRPRTCGIKPHDVSGSPVIGGSISRLVDRIVLSAGAE
jgi:hypothetical protein